MKRLSIFLLILCCVVAHYYSYAQNTVNLKQIWKKQLTGSSGDEVINDMTVHADGTVLIGGRYAGGVVDLAGATLVNPSYSDGFLAQYSATGLTQWASNYNYNNNDAFFGVAFGNNKLPVAVGGANTGFSSFAYSNLLVATANANTGVITSNLSSNGINTNNYISVATDAAGMIYGGGWFSNTNAQSVDVNYTRGTPLYVVGNGTQDAIIVKHTENRIAKWAYKIGGTGSDLVRKVIVSNGFIYAVGTFQGTVDFNAGSGVFNLTAPTAIDNGFLLKIDTAGNFINAWSLNSTVANGILDLAINNAGHLFLAAFYNGTVDVNLGAGTTNITSAGGEDVVLIKMDTAGSLIWSRSFGNASSERINKIALNGNSDIYITGNFQSATLNLGWPNTNMLTNAQSNQTTMDGFVAAYDSTGTNLCAYRYGGIGNDYFSAIAFDGSNNLYVGGYFTNSIETDFASGYSSISTASGGYDAVVIKYNTVCPYWAPRAMLEKVACAGNNLQLPTEIFGSNVNIQWYFNGAAINNGTKYNGVSNDTLFIQSLQNADTGYYYAVATRGGCSSIQTDSIKATVNNGLIPAPTFSYRFEGNYTEENGGAAAAAFVDFTADRFNNASKAYNQGSAFVNIDVPNLSSSDYALTMWFSHNSTAIQTLFHGGTTVKELQLVNNKLGMLNGTFVDFGITLTPNVWYHIGYVKNGTKCTVYINGEKRYENATLLTAASSSILTVFGTSSGAEGVIGKCDELRMYSNALSASEVQSIYLTPQQLSYQKLITKCTGAAQTIQTKINGAQSYQWYKNGNALTNSAQYAGVNTDSLVIANLNSSDNGEYYLQATNSCVTFVSKTTSLYAGNPQLTQGLIGNFLFNNSLADATNSLTATGTINYAVQNRFANSSPSATFQQASGKTSVSFPSIATDSLSVSFWMYDFGQNFNRTLLSTNTSSARLLSINSSNKIGYTNQAGTFISSGFTFIGSAWTHVVVTKAGNNQKIYVNGELIMNDNNSYLNSIAANAFTRIGGATGSTEPANAYIDDVKIYNREITPVEVAALGKYFEVKIQPNSTSGCSGVDNLGFISTLENADSTKYSIQWKRNGLPISNGAKFVGASNDTLWVVGASYADTGLYAIEATLVDYPCVVITSSSAKLSMSANTQLTDSLKWHLRFSGNTTDASKGAINTSTSNAITYASDRIGGTATAAVFNGTSSLVGAFGVLPTTQNTFTVMAWFKSNQAIGGIVSNTNALPPTAPSASNAWLYIGSDNKLRGKAYNGNATSMASSAIVNDNQWHHAALVVTPTLQYLYLDGVQVASQTATAAGLPTSLVVVGNLYGGWTATNSAWNNYFQGSIDEVKIYNTALTGSEIARTAQVIGFTFGSKQTNSYCNNVPVTIPSLSVGTGLNYQWYKNGIPLVASANISLVDSSGLRFVNITSADTGFYQCAITKNCLTIFSDTIKVNVTSTITINNQPQNGNVCLGAVYPISVSATGSGLQYQWKKNGVNLVNGATLSGVNADTLRILNAQIADSGSYVVTITDACGNTITSAGATISVGALPAPIAKVIYPLNGNGNANYSTYNGSASLVSSATNRFSSASSASTFTRAQSSRVTLPTNLFGTGNAPFTVSVWFKTTTAATTMGLIGTASGNPTPNPTAGWSPIVYITNGGKLTGKFYDLNTTMTQSANSVTDGVWHQAVLTGNGSSQSLYLDGVLVGVSNGTYSTTSTPYTIIGASFSNNNGWSGHTNGWQYFNGDLDDVRIYSTYTTSTEVAKLFNMGEITAQPVSSVAICSGQNQTLSVTTSGNNTQYQWYKNGAMLVDGGHYSGVTTANLTVSNFNASDSGKYYCRVANDCRYVASDSSTLLLNSVPVISTQPSNQSSCVGGNIVIGVAASGYGLSYQWKKDGADLANSGNVSGVNTAQLSINTLAATDTALYTCVITNACGSVTSNAAKVSLGTSLQILQQPQSQNFCQGSNALLVVRTTDPGANYTWQLNGGAIASSNNDTLAINAFSVLNTGNYRVIVNSVCGTDTSAVAVIGMNSLPQITTQPKGVIGLCGSSSISISVGATGTGLTYQWAKNGVNIPNATTANYVNSTPLSTDTGNYQVIVSGVCGSPILSMVSRVNISQQVNITSQPISSLTICSGNNSYVNLFVVANGSILGYQWYRNGVAINNQTNVSGATGNNLQFLNYTLGAGTYTCKVFGACDTVTSTGTVFGYYQNPQITQQPISQAVCAGGNVNFTVKATNAGGYRWFLNGFTMNDISGKITGTSTDSVTALNITSGDIGGLTGVVYVEVLGLCPSQVVQSNQVQLSLVNGITIQAQTNSKAVCEKENLALAIKTDATATYQWKKDGNSIQGATNDTLYITSATSGDAATYTCVATSSCGTVISSPIVITVNALPVAVVSQNGNTLSTTSFNSYQWYQNNNQLSGATAQSYQATSSGLYFVRVTNNAGCSASSDTVNFIYSGLNDVALQSRYGVKLFPNPATSFVAIQSNTYLNNKVIITDIVGRLIGAVSLDSSNSINIENLNEGVYLINITTTANERIILKFEKK